MKVKNGGGLFLFLLQSHVLPVMICFPHVQTALHAATPSVWLPHHLLSHLQLALDNAPQKTEFEKVSCVSKNTEHRHKQRRGLGCHIYGTFFGCCFLFVFIVPANEGDLLPFALTMLFLHFWS